MAVSFGSNTTNRIEVPSPQAIGAGSAFTLCAWVYRTSDANSQGIGQKAGNIDLMVNAFSGSGDFSGYVTRAGVSSERISSAGLLTQNAWLFMAAAYNETEGVRLYLGSTTTTVAEVSYALETPGSGNTSTETGTLYLMNRGTGSNSQAGNLAHAHWITRKLTLDELKAQQYQPHVVSGSTMFFIPWSTGTIQDYSGAGNNGTGVGISIADHAPLPHPFPPRQWRVVWQSTGGGAGAVLEAVVTASATVAAALTVEKPLAAAVTATSTVAAALTVDKPLASAISATATLAADLTVAKPLVAAVTATSTIAADLTVAKPLESTVSASVTLAASLTVDKPLATSVTATATVAADLTIDEPLSAIIVCGATIAADLSIPGLGPALNSAIAATATITANLTVAKPLDVVVICGATLAGVLTVPKPLAAMIGPTALLVANLTIPQDITPGTLLGVVTVLPRLSAVQSIRPALSGIVELEP